MYDHMRGRQWRVTLSDGRVIKITGRKLIETDAGSLLIVGPQGERHE